MQTFSQWYHAFDVIDRPQHTSQLTDGERYLIVYSTDPGLWRLSDYVVSSQQSFLVHLVKRVTA